MKINIFLDVDGVLNGFSKRAILANDHIWYNGKVGRAGLGGLFGMRRSNVDNFKLLYDTLKQEHEVNLVLSSSWRNTDMDRFKELICEHGFYNLDWPKTPWLGSRGLEIKKYIELLPENEKPDFIIIIDDEMFDISKHFLNDNNCYLLRTKSYYGGLTTSLVQKTLERLTKSWSNESL